MLLQHSPVRYEIPHTSKCHIISVGTFHDGDVVSITSPIFSSIDFTSKQFNLTESFYVVLKGECVVPAGGLDATLVSDDNDIFNMYVRI
jgi:hypothetical protein